MNSGGDNIAEKPEKTGAVIVKNPQEPTVIAASIIMVKAYRPYPVDWRFLPESVLLLKDTIRHFIVRADNGAACSRPLRKAWLYFLGRSTATAINQAGLLFIHIPKTAGTSISQRLYRRNLPHYTARFYQDVFRDEVSGVPCFSVLRDPVKRFLSAYKFIASGGSDVILACRYQRSRLHRYLYSPDALVDFLYANPALLRQTTSLIPQADFVLDSENRIMIDRLFAMDEADELPPMLGSKPNQPLENMQIG